MGREIPYNYCDKCLVYKSLTGSYTIEGIKYEYRVCPRCYPARFNVHNMLRKLHNDDKKNRKAYKRDVEKGLRG